MRTLKVLKLTYVNVGEGENDRSIMLNVQFN